MISFLALAIVVLGCFAGSSCAEYDILTRYNVTRPEGGRHFWLYSPTQYQHAPSPSPLPLAMFFHGYSDVCEEEGFISQFSIWAYTAEVHQYHIAVMCGTNPGPGWTSGLPRGPNQPDDMEYTRAALKVIKNAVKVRDGGVFAMGHSNGAMMSELLACNCSDIINGIGSNAGTTLLGPTIPDSLAWCTAGYAKNQTSILKIHGTADQAVIYNGTASFPGAVADMQAWADRNQCKGKPQILWSRGIATAQGWTAGQCQGSVAVELVSLTGVNHQWAITSDLRSTDYVFDFFNRVLAKNQHRHVQQN